MPRAGRERLYASELKIVELRLGGVTVCMSKEVKVSFSPDEAPT